MNHLFIILMAGIVCISVQSRATEFIDNNQADDLLKQVEALTQNSGKKLTCEQAQKIYAREWVAAGIWDDRFDCIRRVAVAMGVKGVADEDSAADSIGHSNKQLKIDSCFKLGLLSRNLQNASVAEVEDELERIIIQKHRAGVKVEMDSWILNSLVQEEFTHAPLTGTKDQSKNLKDCYVKGLVY